MNAEAQMLHISILLIVRTLSLIVTVSQLSFILHRFTLIYSPTYSKETAGRVFTSTKQDLTVRTMGARRLIVRRQPNITSEYEFHYVALYKSEAAIFHFATPLLLLLFLLPATRIGQTSGYMSRDVVRLSDRRLNAYDGLGS